MCFQEIRSTVSTLSNAEEISKLEAIVMRNRLWLMTERGAFDERECNRQTELIIDLINALKSGVGIPEAREALGGWRRVVSFAMSFGVDKV